MRGFRQKMCLHLKICYIKIKMTLSLEAGANLSTWKLTGHLIIRIKSSAQFYRSCIMVKFVLQYWSQGTFSKLATRYAATLIVLSMYLLFHSIERHLKHYRRLISITNCLCIKGGSKTWSHDLSVEGQSIYLCGTATS